jgi:hypothetical protein
MPAESESWRCGCGDNWGVGGGGGHAVDSAKLNRRERRSHRREDMAGSEGFLEKAGKAVEERYRRPGRGSASGFASYDHCSGMSQIATGGGVCQRS